MALIPCPECGRMVSPNAEECPNCGAPVKELLASNASTVPSERPDPIDIIKNTPYITEETGNTPTDNSVSGDESSQNVPKKKKKAPVWILIALGVIILAVVACIFLRDDDGLSSQAPYHVQYGYTLGTQNNNEVEPQAEVCPTETNYEVVETQLSAEESVDVESQDSYDDSYCDNDSHFDYVYDDGISSLCELEFSIDDGREGEQKRDDIYYFREKFTIKNRTSKKILWVHISFKGLTSMSNLCKKKYSYCEGSFTKGMNRGTKVNLEPGETYHEPGHFSMGYVKRSEDIIGIRVMKVELDFGDECIKLPGFPKNIKLTRE